MNRIKSSLVFLVVIAVTIILSSCVGSDDDPRPTYDIDAISKEYCVFEDGSRWIYKLEGSSFADTIILSGTETITEDPGNELSSDGFTRWHYRFESLNNSFSPLSGNGYVIPLTSTPNPEISEMIFRNGGIPQIAIFLGSDSIGANSSISNSGTKVTLVDKRDSLAVDNIIYYKVLVFENNSLLWSDVPTKIYWASGIGRIRIEHHNGEIWNLKEHVIK
jgi:hypothetical protein